MVRLICIDRGVPIGADRNPSLNDFQPDFSASSGVSGLGSHYGADSYFELGADILRTAIAPTWSEIGQLAAIATVRTALNHFLQQEIDNAAARRTTTADQGVGATGAGRTETPASKNRTT